MSAGLYTATRALLTSSLFAGRKPADQTATRGKTRAKLEHSPPQRTSHENSYSRLVQFKNIPDLKIHVTLQVKMQDTARDRSATGLHLPAPGWATEETRLPGCYSLNEGCAAGSIGHTTPHEAAHPRTSETFVGQFRAFHGVPPAPRINRARAFHPNAEADKRAACDREGRARKQQVAIFSRGSGRRRVETPLTNRPHSRFGHDGGA